MLPNKKNITAYSHLGEDAVPFILDIMQFLSSEKELKRYIANKTLFFLGRLENGGIDPIVLDKIYVILTEYIMQLEKDNHWQILSDSDIDNVMFEGREFGCYKKNKFGANIKSMRKAANNLLLRLGH